MGISGLETALALSLSALSPSGGPALSPSALPSGGQALSLTGAGGGALDPLSATIAALTAAPVDALSLGARISGLGTLSAGAPGDVAIVDPGAEWAVEPELFASKGKNTPLAGRTLKGRVVATVVGGKAAWQA
jgi:dihydroorotase-like cyclic amidohydrolase